ncbi:MAG: hypothetical protein A2W02_00205 [Alphaproteobacteria bacterium RBG_16_64_48]|nr:MAG: hypothetical protein A2W02_00205 [Alphaproteobacteria bacterium RBG_16_64_48]
MPKDEDYIIEICNDLLGCVARRRYCFDFLRGDPSVRTQRRRMLPVDAYYPDLKLVIEYREIQHFEPTDYWDRKITATGMTRGRQRRIYDKRRRNELPKHGIKLIELDCKMFGLNSRKRLRRHLAADRAVIESKLKALRDD